MNTTKIDLFYFFLMTLFCTHEFTYPFQLSNFAPSVCFFLQNNACEPFTHNYNFPPCLLLSTFSLTFVVFSPATVERVWAKFMDRPLRGSRRSSHSTCLNSFSSWPLASLSRPELLRCFAHIEETANFVGRHSCVWNNSRQAALASRCHTRVPNRWSVHVHRSFYGMLRKIY